ncbi:MAG: metallophosphoesterase [Clostridia bacterium]|nr:metallophosphoesterase [Clostridia bacterium]
MDTIRILHMADMHLGSAVSMFEPTKNIIRRSEIEQSALRVFDMCKNADVVLMAGDIFDSGNCPTRIADMIISKIKNCPRVRFFFSCGNHDPYNSFIVKYLIQNSPDNLHVFSTTAEYIEIKELKTGVWGASFDGEYCPDSLLDPTLPCRRDYINLLCIHGELTDGRSIYNPLSVSSMESMGFDYAALGHVHAFSGIKKSGKLSYAYCGVHEPNGFDECGEKGVVFGEIIGRELNFKFVPTALRKYIDETLDITDIASYPALIEQILQRCENKNNICKINLVGNNSLGYAVNLDYIMNAADCFSLTLSDETSLPIDFSAICNDISLKGLCAVEILKRLENSSPEEKDQIRKSGAYLLDILDGRYDGFDY